MIALLRAFRARLHSSAPAGSEIVMPLRGGFGALLPNRLTRRLVSMATHDDAEHPSPGVTGVLERLQAMRSAILLVPDRPTGVAIALRWRLSPEKFRLEGDYRTSSREPAARPWHAR